MANTREINWRELVQRVEGPTFYLESRQPVVYVFSNGKTRRDSGPEKGIYEGA